MTRCALAPRSLLAALAFAVPMVAAAQGTLPRHFPATALRGEIVVTQPPVVTLNGQPARLAPGARIRGANDMQILSGALVGQKLTTHYTLDTYGLVKDVWVLRPDELAKKPWPKTAAEAAAWRFDAFAQTWTKP